MEKPVRILAVLLLIGMLFVPKINSHAAETEVQNRWGITLTQEEQETLAKLLWHEAANQTRTEQYKVVAVVFNRMNDGRFGGTTLYEVLDAPRQFMPLRKIQRLTLYQTQLDIVGEVLDGTSADTTDNFSCLYWSGNGRRNFFR